MVNQLCMHGFSPQLCPICAVGEQTIAEIHRRSTPAARRTVDGLGPLDPADIPVQLSEAPGDTTGRADDPFTPPAGLNWGELLERELPPPDWLPGKLMARGEQISLVGDGKVGKSLLALEWAWRASAGQPFLGDVARTPLRVLYVDMENTRRQLQTRLRSLGAKPDELANLTYLSFPPFGPLNINGNARNFHNTVEHYNPDLIILDTVSRMVEGDENDSRTWLEFYRLVVIPLKAAGRASIRLDHFGKDKTRGGRGSSAKTQDIDHVWELTAAPGYKLSLKRTHTRSGEGTDSYTIHRQSEKNGDSWVPGRTRHVLTTEPTEFIGLATQEIARRLDDAGISRSAGRPTVRDACKDIGLQVNNEVLSAVIRLRKDQPDHAQTTVQDSVRTVADSQDS